jgi:quercetin dioxygenase-like cupin family protein
MAISDSVYTGPAGETSALFRAAEQPPGYRTAKGTVGHFLAEPQQTGGAFSLYRWDMSAESGGPDPHFHRTYAETFYVLSGTIRLYDGTTWHDARPGDLLYVPRGGVHAFTNASGAPASMLMLMTPGADRGAYFAELAEIAASGRDLAADEWAELHARHDNVMLDL